MDNDLKIFSKNNIKKLNDYIVDAMYEAILKSEGKLKKLSYTTRTYKRLVKIEKIFKEIIKIEEDK